MAKKKEMCPLTKPKSKRELEDMKRAIAVTEKVFRELGSPFGRSERDVASEICAIGRGCGASLSFRPIVASGSNSGYVHHRRGRKIVREDETVIFDIGFKVGGQCSDVTRMHIPHGKKFEKLDKDVLLIQRECMKLALPGKTMKEIHGRFRSLMGKKGYKVRHGIGHGLGMKVHERVKGQLRPGMVITIEPGVYEKKKCGCRYEDMLLITRSKPVILTKNIKTDFLRA